MVTGFSAPGKVAGRETAAQKTANFRNKGFNLVAGILN
jgi:hypothetical protein